jgi:hypothetical protein
MPQAPTLSGPGLPDYDQARNRARALNTSLYTKQDIRRAGGQAQTAGNAVARNQMAQYLSRGGSMGGGSAALVGGSLYGAAAMAGLDASRGMDLEERRGKMEGEFRREGILSSIDDAQSRAAIGTTQINQNAANANRDFDYRAYADNRDMDLRERSFSSDEAERRRRAQQDDWRFSNEQRYEPFNPANPYNPQSPISPFNNRTFSQPDVNNSSSASWSARYSRNPWMY